MSATATPTREPQHLRALERANRVRLARADLKRRVATGDVCAAEVVAACPWEAASMTLAELLTSQRRWGAQRCRRFLLTVSLPETKTLGSLTDRQRGELVRALSPAAASSLARA